MKNKKWVILFTDKSGESNELEFEWHEQPSLEKAASRIVYEHQKGQQHSEIIDVLRTDQTPNLTQMAYFGYKIIDIKPVQEPDAQMSPP
jgi:hypothetical protein